MLRSPIQKRSAAHSRDTVSVGFLRGSEVMTVPALAWMPAPRLGAAAGRLPA